MKTPFWILVVVLAFLGGAGVVYVLRDTPSTPEPTDLTALPAETPAPEAPAQEAPMAETPAEPAPAEPAPARVQVTIAAPREMPPRRPDSPIALALPVKCEIGPECFVQNYVDTDPGPGIQDHLCGPLAYDGHKGVDIRTKTYGEMRLGVPVVAAAPGVVKALRDAMPDISFRDRPEEEIKGREAGNGVVIDHGNGWETQYSHLRRGSVAVIKGQKVETGQTIGMIGLSGRTEFPHLDFTVRLNGEHLDPFTGLPIGAGCGESAGSLWDEPTRQALAYRAGGLLVAGFADREIKVVETVDGSLDDLVIGRDTPLLLFYATSWGLLGQDRETMRLLAPDGSVVSESTGELPKSKARWVRYIGRKKRGELWPAGLYRGEYRIERDTAEGTEIVVEITREIELR